MNGKSMDIASLRETIQRSIERSAEKGHEINSSENEALEERLMTEALNRNTPATARTTGRGKSGFGGFTLKNSLIKKK